MIVDSNNWSFLDTAVQLFVILPFVAVSPPSKGRSSGILKNRLPLLSTYNIELAAFVLDS